MSNNEHPPIEQLTDYVHGELSEHEDATVHAHLAQCSTCAEAHETEARLGEILRQHARLEERELPPGFAARIVDAAVASGARSPGWWQSVATIFRPAIALPAAAAVALAVYLSLAATHPSIRTAPIDAAAYMESHTALATNMPFADSAALPVSFASDLNTGGASAP